MLWKYVIFSLVRVDTEDEPFKAHKVWKEAWSRFERKALAKVESIRSDFLRAESRGDEKPEIKGRADPLAPIATLDEEGCIVWNKTIVDKIKKLAEK